MSEPTITLNQSQAKLLIKELDHLEKIKKTLLMIIPESYFVKGSELWWAKSELEADEDKKAGRVTEVKTHKELDNFLNSL